jgi:signal transduction histidine kinase
LQSRINEKRRELLIVQKNLEKERIKSLQDQLKNEKLAAIGQLAARISHDLKNPLTVLQGSMSLAKIKPTTDLNEISKRNDRMDRAISRMSHQINNVLDFVKIKEPVINEVTISSIINSTLEHLELPTTITIQKEGVDYTLECDENLLEIVFVNIITNAIHAMDSSGIITVRTTEQVDHITVEIENNGPEIPKDTLEHIFEPLFTTKMTGTGLGLVSCNTIIKQHKGTITAHNDPTKFVIKIPKTSHTK